MDKSSQWCLTILWFITTIQFDKGNFKVWNIGKFEKSKVLDQCLWYCMSNQVALTLKSELCICLYYTYEY